MRLPPPDPLTTILLYVTAVFMAVNQALTGTSSVTTKYPALKMGGEWNYVPVALLTLAAAIWVVRAAMAASSTSPKTPERIAVQRAQEASVVAEREFLPDSFSKASLDKLTQGLTSAQAESVLANYSGRWVRFGGPVYDIIYVDDASVMVIVKNTDDLSFISEPFAVFDRKIWGGKLSALQKGDVISGVGKLSFWGGSKPQLSECELT